MTAKEYLRQIHGCKVRIKQKQEELRELLDYESALRSPGTEGERVQTSGTSDKTGSQAIKIIESEADIRTEIEALIRDLVIRKNKIINEIQKLSDDRYAELLFKRYVEDKSLELISVEMGYNYEHVRKLHGYALHDFENKILNN